jgi:hypothetical protein
MIYTDDQREIIDFLREQLNPEGSNVIVSGAGGVGKTAMLCQFISELLLENYTIAVTAMTGKATAVLRDKIYEALARVNMQVPKKEVLLIETVSKLTKESKVLGVTDSGDTLYTNTWRNPERFDYDILFVDELSMVPHFISQWWRMAGIRVFGFGDHCQLPEVTTNETKKELAGFKHDLKIPNMQYTSGYGVKVLKDMAHKTLYTVLRSDNEIALLCGELRDFTQSKREIVQRIKRWAENTDNIQYSNNMDDLERDNDWQIIAYTNKMCQNINNSLCIGEDYPDPRDKIILFDNLNPLKLYNGDVLTFHEFLNNIARYNTRNQKRKVFVCMKWQNKMPRKDSGNPIEREFFMNYVLFKEESKHTNARRLAALPSIIRNSGYGDGLITQYLADLQLIEPNEMDAGKRFNAIVERFYDVDRDMAHHIMDSSEPLPRLYMVSADYGYAITTHKSQGSEYPRVCYLLERFDRPLLYTGISRAKEQVKVINLTSEK